MNPQQSNLSPLRLGHVSEQANFGHQFGTLEGEGSTSGLMYPEGSVHGKQAETQIAAPSISTELGTTAVGNEVSAPDAQVTGLESYKSAPSSAWERPSKKAPSQPTTGLESYGRLSAIHWVQPSKIPKAPVSTPAPQPSGSMSRRFSGVDAIAGQRVDAVTGHQEGNAYFRNLAQQSEVADRAKAEEPAELFGGIIGENKDVKLGKRLEDVPTPPATTRQIGAVAATQAVAKAPAPKEEVKPNPVVTPPRPQKSGPGTTGVIGAEIFDDEGDSFQGFRPQAEDFIPKTGDARTRSTPRTYNRQPRVHE